ncbi:MAG TPA: gamma-glutamyltransferase family protein [Acidocella sp.]|jgi:gamma-glutamyltranspeptidase/glutathione hydrolase|uniref:gamma-glutamyltransferase family protein n=1 Tax=Acidocella sp. TaxID=50710 RepID=UPI002B5FCD4E|nr:gamma-glutamyltransferase family protein [Acidocella sp.]HVE21370.1 gamma-glutamyltransferase family protein [Acidocella sp.]
MSFNWQNPYPTVRMPVMARNVVATSQPLAAQAGLRILSQGGNAVDAAIAAAAMLTIVEPVSNGLGSDAFALLWDGKELVGLNASGTAPVAWSPDYFRRKYGEDGNGHAVHPARGWDAATVPGAIAAWSALHGRFGRLSLGDILQPAIEIAERGYAVTPVVGHKWIANAPPVSAQPGFAETFMPYGRVPAIGERFVFKTAAATLRALVKNGLRSFYEGELAEKIATFSSECGGAMTYADLAGYQPEWVTPISKRYRGYDVHELPPNGQGIAALIALGILNNFDLESLPVDGVESQHLQIEAMKLAFSDVYRYVADPRAMEVSPGDMLDENYLAERARLIDRTRAQTPTFGMPRTGGTIYLTAADESGMMVSFIQSNYRGFGSGIVVPGTGISLQNRGYGFSMDPCSPNMVAGGKRPFHTIIPAFLTKDGSPVMSFGVMGGDMQPQGHLQTLVHMLDYKQQPQAACDAPRWKVNRDFTLDVEATMRSDTVQALEERGHRLKSVEDPYMDFGSGQFIWRLSENLEDGYVAASDSRRDGHAAAF